MGCNTLSRPQLSACPQDESASSAGQKVRLNCGGQEQRRPLGDCGAILAARGRHARFTLGRVPWGCRTEGGRTCCTVCLCPGCVRLATVLATKVIISFTAPRWKNPKLDRSAATPSMFASLSPFHFINTMAVSFMLAVSRISLRISCRSSG